MLTSVPRRLALGLLLVACWGEGCGSDFEGPALVTRWGWMYVTDFDGDGRSDILANRLPRTPSFLLEESSAAMLSGAEGLTRVATPAAIGHHQATVGDVTGDGVPDLIIPDGVVVVVPGGSGPPWQEIVSGSLPPSGWTSLVGLIDVDDDGHLDVLAWRHHDAQLLLMRGRGAGRFANGRLLPLPFDEACFLPMDRYAAAALGDFDGDGLVDVVLACSGPPAIMLVRSDGGNLVPGWRHRMHDRTVALVLGDFDGDGKPDVATLHLRSGSGSDEPSHEDYTNGGRLRIHTGWDADGPSESRAFEVGVAPVDLVAGDLDGDEVDDIVVANLHSRNFHVLLSSGATPRMREIDIDHRTSAVALGDVDDDGDLDVLLRRSVIDNAFGSPDFPHNELIVFENRGAGELRLLDTYSFDEEDEP